ncbi:hypothetical protein B296_00000944 [Ensete ventricosum]|uniref:Uncharacterized protein n=1 Tax=Ensete ventricosum TaxID=4639 RepID=A0A427ANS6_ENSVE|nr:hypothetical protein B296_00000944 [Ensete ventricosum]
MPIGTNNRVQQSRSARTSNRVPAVRRWRWKKTLKSRRPHLSMNWAMMSLGIEEVADEVLLCQPAEIDDSELLPADGTDGDHKVLRPIQNKIKGF